MACIPNVKPETFRERHDSSSSIDGYLATLEPGGSVT